MTTITKMTTMKMMMMSIKTMMKITSVSGLLSGASRYLAKPVLLPHSMAADSENCFEYDDNHGHDNDDDNDDDDDDDDNFCVPSPSSHFGPVKEVISQSHIA